MVYMFEAFITLSIGGLAGAALTFFGLKQSKKKDVSPQNELMSFESRVLDNYNELISQTSDLLGKDRDRQELRMQIENLSDLQRLLLPKSGWVRDEWQVLGDFFPATECSGDWWHYFTQDDFMYIWIGDVTGHGAAQAAMAATAKGILEAVCLYTTQDLKQACETSNALLHRYFGQQLSMTLMGLKVDLTTGKYVGVNCGHDPAYLLHVPKEEGDGFEIIDSVSPTDSIGIEEEGDFESFTGAIGPGEVILLYTDGLVDLFSRDGRKASLRRMGLTFAEKYRSGPSAKATHEYLSDIVNLSQDLVELEDDITYAIIGRAN